MQTARSGCLNDAKCTVRSFNLELYAKTREIQPQLAGAALLRTMGICEFTKRSVGADAHIGPFGSYGFAAEFRKIGAFCWVDVGIDPYKHGGKCFALDFRKSAASCGRTKPSAPAPWLLVPRKSFHPNI